MDEPVGNGFYLTMSYPKDYIPKIEDKRDEKPKRIVPKNDSKQKSLFEF